MTPARKLYLIKKFEDNKPEEGKKGKSGRFYYLFLEFKSVISDLHNNQASIYDIGDAIEEVMEFEFAKTKYDTQDPFYRAIRNHIKSKIEGKSASSKSKPYTPILVPGKITSDKIDRSDLIAKADDTTPFTDEPS